VKKFEDGDVVCHIVDLNKYYTIIRDRLDGTFEVEDFSTTNKLTHIFIGEYLLSKSEKREYILNELLKD
jgi:hypothetical protein